MRVFKRLIVMGMLAALLLPLGVAQAAPSSPQDTQMPRYFSETGFWVQGVFRQYWETHGGLYIQGYPITGVFQQDGMWVQYFERARFEWHPDNPDPYKVELTLLGNIRTENRRGEQPFQPIAPFANSSDHVYFDATHHALSYGFKTFWNDNQGIQNFGYPISEEFTEKNPPPPAGDGQAHTVQYFERSRFEYHPEYKGTKYEVLLGLLGREYLNQRGAPPEAVARQDPNMPPPDPITGALYAPHAAAGFNVYLRGDDSGAAFNDQALNMVTNAGFTWVHFQLPWNGIEPQPGHYDSQAADRIINQVAGKGLKMLVSVVGPPPAWAGTSGIPDDTSHYQALMSYLTARYQGKVQAWELWNEENLAYTVGGQVSVGKYVNLLKAGYQGVKSVDPNTIVLFGALTPNGVNDPSIAIDDVQFLKQVYAYNNGEVKQYFDALGAHPGSNNNPPDTMWPNNPGPGPGWQNDPSFYFRRVEQLRQVMIDNHDAAKQIWLTEFGWTTANQAPGYEYGAQNSDQDQANYLVRAFQIGQTEWPWIGPMFVWNLNYSVVSPPSDEKTPWAVLNADWSPRPSYTALKNMPK
ncbi:MAG TPA: beta-galactosidase [Thermomicrobiaceae bacterium]|nr:beta-galactosidase [Thermomicrobiaceae bacterium]